MVKTNVTKIEIKAYRDKKLLTDFVGSFIVPVTPEQLSQKFEVKSNNQQGTGNQGTNSIYAVTLPEELKLDFYLDNTNTIEGNYYQDTPVPEQVKRLLNILYYMDGDSHRSLFLKISFGKGEIFGTNRTTFDCILKSLDINYVLFKPDGEPLRAKVNAVFESTVAAEKRTKDEGKNSSDLTHVRTATPSNQLWLMAHKIYGAPDYLLQVARANNLNTLRQLKPGDEVLFPPFDRNETIPTDAR